jgi:hypothetical protein
VYLGSAIFLFNEFQFLIKKKRENEIGSGHGNFVDQFTAKKSAHTIRTFKMENKEQRESPLLSVFAFVV